MQLGGEKLSDRVDETRFCFHTLVLFVAGSSSVPPIFTRGTTVLGLAPTRHLLAPEYWWYHRWNSAVAEAFISDITSQEEKKTIFSTIGGSPDLDDHWTGRRILCLWKHGYLGTILFAGYLLGTLLFISTYVQESLRKSQTPNRTTMVANLNLPKTWNLDEVLVRSTLYIKMLFSALMSIYVSTIVSLSSICLNWMNGFGTVYADGGCSWHSSKWLLWNGWWQLGIGKTLQGGLLLSTLGFFLITKQIQCWSSGFITWILVLQCMPTSPVSLNMEARDDGWNNGDFKRYHILSYTFVPIVAAYVYGQIGYQWLLGISLSVHRILPFSTCVGSCSLKHSHPNTKIDKWHPKISNKMGLTVLETSL